MNNGETLSLWGRPGAVSFGARSFWCTFQVAGPWPYSSSVPWSPVPRRSRDLGDMENTRSRLPKPPEAILLAWRANAQKPASCSAHGAWSADISGCSYCLLPEPAKPSSQLRPCQALVTPSTESPGHSSTHTAACSKGVQERNCCLKQTMGFCLLRRWRERWDRVCGCVNAKLGSLPRH